MLLLCSLVSKINDFYMFLEAIEAPWNPYEMAPDPG